MGSTEQHFQEFGGPRVVSEAASHQRMWGAFTMRRIIALALVVTAGGFWWWSTSVVVIAPNETPAPVDQYFGADVDSVVAHEIFQVRGRFWESRDLVVTMYVVTGKTVETGNSITCGTTSARFYGPLGESLILRMALMSRPNDGGNTVTVGCRGCMRGGGALRRLVVPFQRTECAFDGGYLPSDREVVAYADGDRPFDLRHHMTVDQFVSENEGHFVLVAVRLE
jgi:hypothetical protein